MISNQVLQNTLEGLKEISRTEFCIIDTEGKVLATTFADFSIQPGDIQAFVESQADSQLVKGFQYFKVCDDYQLEYVLVAHGDDEDTYMVGKLAALGSCVTIKMVRPCTWLTSCNFSISNRAAFVSNAPVGSSAKIISGLEIKLRAAATRCF